MLRGNKNNSVSDRTNERRDLINPSSLRRSISRVKLSRYRRTSNLRFTFDLLIQTILFIIVELSNCCCYRFIQFYYIHCSYIGEYYVFVKLYLSIYTIYNVQKIYFY